jgi:flavin reductase (DIM6/NTAB) family NADH-FMN oxidoreductase RutF
MAEVPHSYGGLGVPVLRECYAAFECRVVNTMDAGASTFFLADVIATHGGSGTDIMTAEYLRANLPEEWREDFGKNYREAQERIAANSAIKVNPWPGPTSAP